LQYICRPEDIATVNVHAAKDLLGSSHCYLDVRTPAESCKSHITNASNVPYMFITQEGNSGCNSGGRFLGAYVDLLNAGYEDVSNMEGGYSGWVDSGLVGHGKPIEELKNFCKFRP
ncbi:hypothetical protein QQP08_021523, partial [Theobroma cacao]